MKLLSLTLTNVGGAPNGSYPLTRPGDAPLDLVYVTGPASSGKTAFLEAIVALKESVGAYGAPPNAAKLLRRGARTGRIEGTWLLSAAEMTRAETKQATWTTALDLGSEGVPPFADPALREIFGGYSDDPERGKLEYFPSNRRLAERHSTKPPSLDAEAELRPSSDPGKYAFLEAALVDLALSDGLAAVEQAMARGILLRSDQRDSLAPYRKDIAELAPSIRLVGVDTSGREPLLLFERRDGAQLHLHELSDSEKQAVLFAVTFRRIGLSHSIVLVDQPELYLHPDLQTRFVHALGRLGVDNQIFLATGSPEVMRTAAPHEVVHLGEKR